MLTECQGSQSSVVEYAVFLRILDSQMFTRLNSDEYRNRTSAELAERHLFWRQPLNDQFIRCNQRRLYMRRVGSRAVCSG